VVSRLVPIALAGLVLARGAAACDSTTCLLQTRGDNGVPARGSLQVDASFRYTDMGSFVEGTREVDVVRRPWVDFERRTVWPGFHRERGGTEKFLQVDLLYGVASGTALHLSAPLVTRRDYDVDHGANPFRYMTEGLGDVVLGVRRSVADRGRLVAGLSLKTATGREDVMDEADLFVLEPMIQPGTGALGVVGSLQWSRAWKGTGAVLAGSYQYNTTNRLDYRAGDDLIGSLTLSRTLTGPLSASLQVKGWRKHRSEFVDQPVPSTGGRILYVTPGVRVKMPARSSLYTYVQMPVWRDLNEQQLSSRISILAGVSRSF
jgi:hypothetical protein